MTRLREDWLKTLEHETALYEKELLYKTGLDFVGIAAASNDISPEALREKSCTHKIAVVPVTSGKGVIGGFTVSVAAILRQAGFRAFITEASDVSGVYEAYSKGAAFVFMADDRRYIGLDLNRRHISDNSAATARGFVAALAAMCPETLVKKKVLVLGCGEVGLLAVEALLKRNALPILYDKAPVGQEAGRRFNIPCLHSALDISGYQYILDATDEGGWLTVEMLHANVRIAAPGVPLSPDAGALERHGGRIVHDLLHIGTLAMLGELCCYETVSDTWGAGRIDRIDSKSMLPGETPGPLAKRKPAADRRPPYAFIPRSP